MSSFFSKHGLCCCVNGSFDFAIRLRVFWWTSNMCEMVCSYKLAKGLCTILWPVVWHYDIWNAMCGENLLKCFYDWMRSLIRKFLDVKPPWVIVNHNDVFSSLKIIQVCCNPLPGAGWEGWRHKWFSGRWLFLGICVASGISLPICVESLSHCTEVRALHLVKCSLSLRHSTLS